MITSFEAINILEKLNNYSPEEALCEFINLVNINGTDEALSKVKDMQDNKYLSQHRYKIYYVEKDGRWHSNLPVNGKRKSIAAKTKESLEKKIIDYYKGFDAVKVISINGIIGTFLMYKSKETSPANAKKLQWAYNKYYKDEKISDKQLSDITVTELKEFYLDAIDKFSLTSRAYKEMKSLLNMIYDYALENGLVQKNVSRSVRNISWKRFCPDKKKNAEERIFFGDEEKRIQNAALTKFYETGNTSYLAICLNFFLALRVGEIVALKLSDIEEDYINISRTEVGKFESDEKGVFHKTGYQIVDHAKSQDSIRRIPLIASAKKIINMIIESNKSHGFNSEYLLLSQRGNRAHTCNITRIINSLNKELGISHKSNHGIRRTCLSNMSASRALTDEEIRVFAGHSDISTTQKHYIYQTDSTDDRKFAYESAIAARMSPVLRCTQIDFGKKNQEAL